MGEANKPIALNSINTILMWQKSDRLKSKKSREFTNLLTNRKIYETIVLVSSSTLFFEGEKSMWKFAIIALLTLELVLLSALALKPANATFHDSEIYNWDYASIGSDRLVCKQSTFHPRQKLMPEGSQRLPVAIRSKIVSDRYCANSVRARI